MRRRRTPAAVWALLLATPLAVRGADSTPRLAPDLADQEGLLQPGQTVEFLVEVPADSYLYFGAEQYGVDFVAQLITPNGAVHTTVDGPGGSRGQEVIATTLDEGGDYRVRLRAKEESLSGRYLAWVDSLRPQQPGDLKRAQAERDFSRATHHSGLDTLDDRLAALDLFQATLPTWRELGDQGAVATTLGAMATVQRSLGRLDEALDDSLKAVTIWREIEDRRGLGVALNDLGLIYRRRGDYSEALEALRESRELVKDFKRQLGPVLANLGWVYRDMGEFELATRALQEALAQDLEMPDPASEANRLSEIGWIRAQLGDADEALGAYERALQQLEGRSEEEYRSGILRRRGLTQFNLGHLQRALEDIEEHVSLSRSMGDRVALASGLTSLGRVHLSLGRFREALSAFEEGTAIAVGAGDRQTEIRSRLGRGETLLRVQAEAAGLAELRRAVELAREIGGRYSEALAKEALGGALVDVGATTEARDPLSETLALWEAIGSRYGEARTLVLLGRMERLEGRALESRKWLDRALVVSHEIGDKSAEAEAHFELAYVERAGGSLDVARGLIEEGIELVEGIRIDVVNEELRSSFLAARSLGYELLIDTLMELHEQSSARSYALEALLVSEQSRARSLLDLLGESALPREGEIDPELIDREQQLRRSISRQQSSVRRHRGSAELEAEARRELDRFLAEYRSLQTRIRAANPRLASPTPPSMEDLQDVRASLDSETLLLEFYFGAERGYLWIVGSDELLTRRLPSRARMEELVSAAREDVTVRNRPVQGEHPRERHRRVEASDASYWIKAGAISAALFGEAGPELAARRWIVVPDGALNYLPLAALPDPASSTEGPPTPLIVDREIVVVPSAVTLSRLRELKNPPSSPKHQLAVVADPLFRAPDSPDQSASNADPRSTSGRAESIEFERLPFSRSEAESILSLVPPDRSLGAFGVEASRDLVMGPDLAKYRWIHFATHGLVDVDNPGLGGLAFSMVDSQGNPTDGFLRLYDIYHLDYSAELVVLSGCRTALGQELRGEGIVGMARGFFAAGVPRVLASVWDVQDKGTRELMERFYHHLIGRGMAPAAALREAQLELWKDTAWDSPYYWAPFVLQGLWD